MHLSDTQLLRRYRTEKSEDAFAELVRRHFNLVYGAAVRQVAGDADLARDITQTVFADLARKASTLIDRASLAGWLYTSTQFAAANIVRGEQRRRAREQKAIVMQEAQPESELNWDQLRPAIDQALQELRADDREAVLLRYFEQREFRAVGEVFGVSEEVARKRVGRALEKLRDILGRSGLTSTTSSLAAALEGQTLPPIPADFVASIAGAALVTGSQPVLSGILVNLMTAKSALVALSAVALVGTLTSISAHRSLHQLRAHKESAAPLTELGTNIPASALDLLELERLRAEHGELIRLRAEVARLRQEAIEMATSLRGVTNRPVPRATIAPPPDPELEPVQTFLANADATLAAEEGLAFGGWSTTPGKRMLIFIEPKIDEPASPGRLASILLHGTFVEVPDEAMTGLGLDALRSESKATSTHNILPHGQLRVLVKELEQMAGVDVLSSPRIQTGHGVQATLSITEQRTIDGQEYTIGPTLDVEPRVTANGSIKLAISARFRKVTGE